MYKKMKRIDIKKDYGFDKGNYYFQRKNLAKGINDIMDYLEELGEEIETHIRLNDK